MKIGVRTPSIKKMTSSRTTGMINRKVKSSINPLYGKSGIGIVNNPEKSIYNKVYNKTTISIKDVYSDMDDNEDYLDNQYQHKKFNVFHLIMGVICLFFGILLYSDGGLSVILGIFTTITGILNILGYIKDKM